MLDIICTRKEKITVFLFFEIYKMMLIIFKSENCSYTGDLPSLLILRTGYDKDHIIYHHLTLFLNIHLILN